MVKDFQRPILLGNFVSSVFNFVFFLLASLLLSIDGVTISEVSLILGGANLAAALAQPFIGRLADTGKLGLIAFIAFISNAWGIYTLTTSDLPTLVVGSTLILISAAVIQTISSRSLEGLSAPADRSNIASLNYMLSNIGYALSAVLAFFFIKSDKHMLLILDVLTTGIACFLIAKYGSIVPPTDTDLSKEPLRDTSQKSNWPNVLNKNALWAIVATLPLFMGLASSFSVIQVVFAEMGLDYSVFSTVVIGISSLAVVAGYYGLKILKPNNFTKIIVGGFLLGLGVSLLSLTTTVENCMIYASIWAIGEILIIGDASAIFYQVVPPQFPGLAAGLKVGSIRLAFVLCPFLIALLGKLNVVNITLSLSIPCLIGALLLYRMKKRLTNKL
jgi:MFS family permease